MFMVIGLIGFFAAIVFVVIGIISAIKKTGKLKKNLLFAGICFVVLIIAVASDPTPSKTATATEDGSKDTEVSKTVDSKTIAPQQTEDPAIKKAEEEKAALEAEKLTKEKEAKDRLEAEKLAKAEEDAKIAAAAEAKKKEKTIEGNGTFAVNDEIKPGIYRSDGNISYWARVSGFSGSLDEILANGSPSGTEIVEILSSDKGFQTMGSGEWVLVDADYKPELLTEFGEGMYFVGKDIAPGTYKSESSVTYWARLNSFTGDLNSIEANGSPSGPEIVEIKSTDTGFQTSGSGTWKKIN